MPPKPTLNPTTDDAFRPLFVGVDVIAYAGVAVIERQSSEHLLK